MPIPGVFTMNTRTCSYGDGFILAVPITRQDLGYLLDGEVLARRVEGVRARSGLPAIWTALYCFDGPLDWPLSELRRSCTSALEMPEDSGGLSGGITFSQRYKLYDGEPVIYKLEERKPLAATPWVHLKGIYYCLADTHEEFTAVLPKKMNFICDPYDGGPIERQHVCSFKM